MRALKTLCFILINIPKNGVGNEQLLELEKKKDYFPDLLLEIQGRNGWILETGVGIQFSSP